MTRKTMRLPSLRSLVDFALVLGGTGFATGTGFLLKILIGRSLGATALGVFGVCFATLSSLSIVADLGIRYSLVNLGSRRLGEEPEKVRSLVAAGLLIKLLGGTAVLLAGWLLAPWAAAGFFHKVALAPYLQMTCVGIFMWTLWDGVEGCLHIRQLFSVSSALRILLEATRMVAFLALFVYRGGVMLTMDRYMWLYFLAPGLAVLVGIPLVMALLRPHVDHFQECAGELVAFSRSVFFYRSGAMLLLFMDSLMLSRYGPLEQVGQFEAAKGLAYALLLVSESLGMVLLPKVNQIRSLADLRQLLVRCTIYFGALSVAAMGWLGVAGHLLVLFGAQFTQAAVVHTFQMLVLSTLVTIPATIMGTVLMSLHRPQVLAAVAALQLSAGLALYPFTCGYGIVATACTGTSLQLLGSLLLFLYLRAQLSGQHEHPAYA